MSEPWASNTYVIRDWTVVDGDTIHAHDVDLGLNTHRSVKIRLYGFDAPEIRRGTDEEKHRGQLAKQALSQLLNRADGVYVTFTETRSFDRWVGEVYADDISTTQWMIESGHTK